MSNESVANALSNIRAMTNIDFWNTARKMDPTFKSWTSEGTADIFTEKGFEELKLLNEGKVLNSFLNLSLRVALNIVNIAQVKDPLSGFDFGETYQTMQGAYLQRMAVHSMKPVSPGYVNLKDGDSIDPYIVRKPELSERFYQFNENLQNFFTWQEYNIKQVIIGERGVGEVVAGVTEQLINSFEVQRYLDKLEALNAYLNSTTYPLRDTQIVVSTFPTKGEATLEQFQDLYIAIKNVITRMKISVQTGQFNSMNFKSTQDITRLRMLIRPGILSRMQVQVLSAAFNKDEYGLGLDILEIDNFGGLKPYKEKEFTTPLYPVYSSIGEMIGYAETEGAKIATVKEDEAYYKDPNSDILAIIADKGVIFNAIQNPTEMHPIFNPRGLYTNYWLSSPFNAVACDHLYNLVAIKGTKPNTGTDQV